MWNLNRIIVATPIVAGILVIVGILASSPSDLPQGPKTKPPIPQDQADASSRTPLGMVVNWARMIKAVQRQPDSVTWEQVLASRDGSVVCLAYRVRVGDGETRERVAFVSNTKGFAKTSWESACTSDTPVVADAAKWISLP